MAKRYAVIGGTKWCSICGMYIPDCVVSADHPLYGTIDHVIPRGRGGRNTLDNRRAAHRWCNNRKGSRLKPLPAQVLCSMQSHIASLLIRVGHNRHASDSCIQTARQRIALDMPTKTQKRAESEAGRWSFHRWGTDGGNCVDLLEDPE